MPLSIATFGISENQWEGDSFLDIWSKSEDLPFLVINIANIYNQNRNSIISATKKSIIIVFL